MKYNLDIVAFIDYLYFYDKTIAGPQMEELWQEFQLFKKYLHDEHFGDCTNFPGPCLRCQAEYILKEAKTIKDFLDRL